jgi:hypothetical protein
LEAQRISFEPRRFGTAGFAAVAPWASTDERCRPELLIDFNRSPKNEPRVDVINGEFVSQFLLGYAAQYASEAVSGPDVRSQAAPPRR